MEGWRFAFLSVAAVSLTIGILNLMYAADPRCQPGQLRISPSAGEHHLPLRQLLREVGSVVRIPTFLIIIVQVCGPPSPPVSPITLILFLSRLPLP